MCAVIALHYFRHTRQTHSSDRRVVPCVSVITPWLQCYCLVLQRQCLEADEYAEMGASDSVSASSRRKRKADFHSADNDVDDMTAHQPKVFRLHAFGGETAQAAGRMQLLQKQVEAQDVPQGNAAGADLEMAMEDDDSDDCSSSDAAATLVDMLQGRGTVAAGGWKALPQA